MWVGVVKHWNWPVNSFILCRGCKSRKGRGFTNLGTDEHPWWVCGQCRRPTRGWLLRQGDDVLHKFVGGPLDGMVYTSITLLDDTRLSHMLLGYRCTGDVVHSQVTGAVARVWEPSATVDTAGTSTQNGATQVTAPETTESAETTEAAAVVETVDGAPTKARREALKLSRTPVAAQAGMTVAQLARIENGGKRTTQAEVDQVNAALDVLEQQTAQAQPAGDAAAPNPV